MRPQPYHDAIKNPPDWRMPCEQHYVDEHFTRFAKACFRADVDFPSSLLISLWDFKKAFKPAWWRKPTGKCGYRSPADRLAYFVLLHGLSEERTYTILKAWHLHHDVTLTKDMDDEVQAMIHGKVSFGKSAKTIKHFSEHRTDKNTIKKRKQRNQNRALKGIKPRLTRQRVFEALPVAIRIGGNDEIDLPMNEGRPRTVDDLVEFLDSTKESVRKHLERLSEKRHIFRNASGVWYRPRDQYDVPTPDLKGIVASTKISSSHKWYKT
jgi:hypothetical protein